ncbi:MAG: DoxX family protein [Bacteroidota bacterium]|nr:DoxX family protein [Bacteroidota bacterium]
MNKKVTITWICRIIVGCLFIFSGFIKANDPHGFGFKLDEYFDIFGWTFFKPWSVGISIIICIAEVMMGVWLIIGFMGKVNAWLLLLMILFFDVLTGYTALANYAKEHPTAWFSQPLANMMDAGKPEMINALSDCGCFGDFIKLTPFQSFSKDIVLTILIIIIFIRRKDIKPIFSSTLSSICSFTAGFVAVAFPIYTYMYLPAKDFLPYKVGNDIALLSQVPKDSKPGVSAFTYHYKNKKTGEVKEYTVLVPEDSKSLTGLEQEIGKLKINKISELPLIDSNWVIDGARSEPIVLREDPKAEIHDFKIYDKDKNEFTDIITDVEGYKLVMITMDMADIDPSYIERFAKTAAELTKTSKIKVIGLTGSDLNMTDSILRLYKVAQVPFFSLDGTQVKSMIRSNPGFILFNKSTIVKKWSKFALPSAEVVMKYVK